MNNFLQGFFSVMSMEHLGVILGSICFVVILVVFIIGIIFMICKILEDW